MLAAWMISRSWTSTGRVSAWMTRSAIALRLSLPDALAEQGELVAAKTGERVAGSQQPLQTPGDLDQDLVAGGVSKCVVDQLEAVEVQVDDREALGGAASGRHPDPVREQGPVREPGERVVECLPGEPFLGLLALGDVLHLRDQVAADPPAVIDGRDSQGDPDRMTPGVLAASLAAVAVALAVGDLAERLDLALAFTRVDDLAERLAEQAVLGAAADLAEGSVDSLEAAIERHERHADAAVVERLAEPLLGLAQRGLGRLSRADVAHEGMEPPLVPLPKSGDGELDGHLGAVAAQALDLEAPRHHRHLIAREKARQPSQVSISMPAGDDRLMDGPPDDLVPTPAEEPLRLRVPLPDQAVLVDRDEGLLGGLEDRPRLAGGLSQGDNR